MKLLKKIANIAKGLTGQKIGSKAARDINSAAGHLSNIKINSKSDLFVYSPDIKSAVTELSRALQCAKVGLDTETVDILQQFQNLLSELSHELNVTLRHMTEATKAVGYNFERGLGDVGTNAVLLANAGVKKTLDELSEMADSFCDRFDDWNDKACQSFERGLKEHGKDAAITLKEGLILFNHTIVCVLLGVMFLLPPSSELRHDWRWFLFVAVFGCLALFLTGFEKSKIFFFRKSKPVSNEALKISIQREEFLTFLDRIHTLEEEARTCSADLKHFEDYLHEKVKTVESRADLFETKVESLTAENDSTSTVLKTLMNGSDAWETELSALSKKLRTANNILMLISNPRPIFPLLDDSAFSASSHYPSLHHHPKSSRIHKSKLRIQGGDHNHVAWHRKDHSGEHNYLQVNLGEPFYITEIQIRGRERHNQYIRRYKVGFVNPETKSETVLTNLDGGVEFDGGYSGTPVYSNKYFRPFVATQVKIYILEYNGNQCTNWELLGVSMREIFESCGDGSNIDLISDRLQM